MSHWFRRKTNRDLLIEISERGKLLMALVDDLKNVLDGIPLVIDQIATDQAGLISEIALLKDQVTNGGAATPAQLAALLDSANAVKTRLEAVDARV